MSTIPTSERTAGALADIQAGPSFWKTEIDRAQRVAEPKYAVWQENLDYYTGTSKDAKLATDANGEWVNVNVDFYETEQKNAQLFYDTPDLQIKAEWDGGAAVGQAHRKLLNELLGPDHADVLTTIQKAIKDCLVPSGMGATKICYEPTIVPGVPIPQQPGDILNLKPTQTADVPIHEQWEWERFSPKKLLIPADFTDTDFDRAPWLGMRFRMPLAVGRRALKLPPDFTGTNTRDEKVLNDQHEQNEPSGLNYVDGIEIWYYAALFDPDVIHPQLMRRHVLIEGVEGFCEKTSNSPYHTLDPQGRMMADSMIGNPIHVLTVRDVPDSAYVPSDSTMRRPLVRELCKFRTQMVQERDASRAVTLADSDAFPPEVLAKIENRTIGGIVLLEGGKLAAGVGSIMAQVSQGTSPRQTYIQNDYIEKDLQKTSGMDASGVGVTDDQTESATKTAEVAKARNVRLDNERRRVLQWYLKGVAKFSALVCRYMTPDLVTKYLGPDQAQLWAQWPKEQVDFRMAFTAKPDSQIRLDMRAEREFYLRLYELTRQDPNAVGSELLKNLYERSGMDPQKTVVDQVPEQKPKPNIGFSFKGEDLIGPQAQMVIEILAQGGIQISQAAHDQAASQLYASITAGIRDPSGKVVQATSTPAEHGGPAQKVRRLSQEHGDRASERPGPKAVEPQ